MEISRVIGLLPVLVGLALAGCSAPPHDPARSIYVTDYGLGPDKWATAWLLTARPGAHADLKILAPGESVQGAIPFDMRDASIRRVQSRSAFEVARDSLKLKDPTLGRLAEIVHQIEVNFWTDDGPLEADLIESAYRDLQYASGRDRVPPECYVAFFDRVYHVLKDVEKTGGVLGPDRLRMACDELVHLANATESLVPEVPIADVLSAMAAGKRVVFVDVREPDEFAEAHVPGALNVLLRDVTPELSTRLAGAEYVVSYCVKDFRGFEMARALADAGVKNSVIMRPFGIKGWVELGLPVTGHRALAEGEALRQLQACLNSSGDCLSQRMARSAT